MAAVINALAANWDELADPSPFVRRTASGEASLDLLVTGAHCANCIAKIEKALLRLNGVTGARFNLSTGKLSVLWSDNALAPSDISRCVAGLGFGVRPFVMDVALDVREEERKFLLRCLAVAGFGTAFVVGLTDATYYGGDILPATQSFFNWLAAAVAGPVTLYAGRPFFRSAISALKAKRGNMDVPISLSLILTLLLSLYQTALEGRQIYFDAAVMLCFTLLIGRFLDFQLRNRAKGAAAELLSMQAGTARQVMPSGDLVTVAARDVLPGQEIFLGTGERSPVDGFVGSETQADVSLVTGESLPVMLAAGTMLYAGSVITGGPVKMRVAACADNSLIAELARILEAGQQNRNHYVRLADRAASLYVPIVHGLSLAVFVGWLAFAPFTVALTNAITILIVTCPCALGLAVPAVQIVASSRLFRRGILIKSGDALERLADINIAIFDKTGTLTHGHPELIADKKMDTATLEQAAQLARASRHPLAVALCRAAGQGSVSDGAVEIPGSGILVEGSGAGTRLGKAEWVGVHPVDDGNSELWFGTPGCDAVRFAFTDTLRADAATLAGALRQRGIDSMILSGDRKEAVAKVARATGITHWRACVDPKTKVHILNSLRDSRIKTLMVGDGLNDTAALACAHVSISLATGIDAAQTASDMVLRRADLAPVAEAIDVARKAKRLVLENLALSAAYNLVAIPVAALGYVTPLMASVAMAASSLIVTLNALRAASGRR